MFLIPLNQVESVDLVIHALRAAGGEADCTMCGQHLDIRVVKMAALPFERVRDTFAIHGVHFPVTHAEHRVIKKHIPARAPHAQT